METQCNMCECDCRAEPLCHSSVSHQLCYCMQLLPWVHTDAWSPSQQNCFYFSWAQLVARVFVSMATLQSDATKNPKPPSSALARYQQRERCSATGWHTDWVTVSPASHSDSCVISIHNPFYNLPQLSSSMVIPNDSAIYYSWGIYGDVSHKKYESVDVYVWGGNVPLIAKKAGFLQLHLFSDKNKSNLKQISELP